MPTAYSERVQSLTRIAQITRQLWPLYLIIALTSLATTVTQLLVPFLIGGATDAAADALAGGTSGAEATRTIVWFAIWIFIAFTAQALVQNLGGYFGDIMGNRLRTHLSVEYYAKLLRLPQSWFDKELTGTIVARLNRSITELGNFAKAFSNTFASMLLTAIAVVVISAWYWWPLALLLLVMFPVYMWLTALTSKRWQQLEGEKNERVDIASGRFSEVIGQIRVVKSFVREDTELAGFSRHFAATDHLTKAQARHWHWMDVARRTSLNIIFFIIYLIVFVRTVRGHFSVGELVILVQLMNLVRSPIEMMSWFVDTAQRAMAGSRDYFEVIDTPDDSWPTTTSQAALPAPVPEAPTVEFDRVTFAYTGGKDVLHEVSFAVPEGASVALVGESGGGKSTIVNLLLGLHRADAGQIRVRGHGVNELPIAEVRSRVGVVFQDASLFSGTIRENIAYGRPDASEEDVRAAAVRANAAGFIEKFPDGYDTVIGERGLKLSGGQRQRIAVARAILKDAPILVLDEATSALDTKAEREVQAGLDELMAGRTSLIIAHRLSTIAAVDTIITLRDGRVDEIGSPAELAQTGGIYAELLALQNSGGKGAKKRLAKFDITG